MINKVTLIGNLGRDPEVRHLESGAIVARLAIATNENYKDKSGEWQTQTEWHNVVVWGPSAESAERNLKKGNMVYIEGKLTTNKWQDKDGKDQYRTEVRARVVRSLEKREPSTGVQQGNSNTTAAPAPPTNNMASDIPKAADDLPF